MAARRPCPVDGCDGTRSPRQLLCRSCWIRVPQPVRHDVWRHWFGRRYAPSAEERATAARAWLAAAREAEAAAAASLAKSRRERA